MPPEPTPTPPPPTPPGPLRKLFNVALIAITAFAGMAAYTRTFPPQGAEPTAADPTAKAVISTVDGGPVADAYSNGDVVVVTAEKSIAAAGPGAVRWEVDPPAIEARRIKLPNADPRHLILVVPPTGRYEARLRLYVTRKDTISATSVSFVVGADAPPDPAPKPPGPKPPDPVPPTPKPEPAGPISEPLKAAAVSYYRRAADNFSGAPAKIAAVSDLTYNDVVDGMKKTMDVERDRFGKEIDAILGKVYDPKTTKFTDKAKAIAAFALVSNTLKAALREAAAQ